jgi:hypothetical protein
MFRGILTSILKSGDGKTPATAFKVIAAPEEYALLNALNFKMTKQSLIENDGKRYDRMDVTDSKTQTKATIYFNIDTPFDWLAKKMGGKK